MHTQITTPMYDDYPVTPESIEGMASNPKLEGVPLQGVRFEVTDRASFVDGANWRVERYVREISASSFAGRTCSLLVTTSPGIL